MKRLFACLLLACPALIATANDVQFYSSSSQSSASAQLRGAGLTLELVRNPLQDSLTLIANTYRVPVLVDADVLSGLQRPVSAKAKALTLESAMQMILEPVGLNCLVDPTHGVIVTAKQVNLEEAKKLSLVSLRRVAIHNALQKRVPLMMFHTPLVMGLQMAQGFSGVNIELDRESIAQAGINTHQLVSVQGGSRTLAESLDALLSPLGLQYEIGENGIIVTAKTAKATPVAVADRV